jgi:putative oxidoreductase
MRMKKARETEGSGIGLLVLRGVVGSLFIAHGLQKLRGWFGGYGLHATGQWFDSIGLRPGERHAAAAGVTETTAGALMVSGLATPLSAAMVTGTMAVAIAKVNGKRGMWATNNGAEYNLVLCAAAFALAGAGPGRLSLDHRLGTRWSGPAAAIGQLAAGLAAAAAILGVSSDDATRRTDKTAGG